MCIEEVFSRLCPELGWIWRSIKELCAKWVGFKRRYQVRAVGSGKYEYVVCDSKVSVGVAAWIKGIVTSGVETSCVRVVEGHIV